MAAPALSFETLEQPTPPQRGDPDLLLVLRAQRERARDPEGENTAFATLMERHRGQVFRRACGILGSSADAEEAVQDAFLSVFRALPNYTPEKPFAHWLSIIVLNACRMILRQRMQEQRRRDQFRMRGDHGEAGPSASDPILRRVLRELLDELPPETRSAIWMRTVEERPHREIADQLQLTESAVKMRIARAWTTLRARYAERVEAEQGLG